MLIIVGFHTFWKIGREADETDQIIHFYGINFSAFFTYICEILTNIVYQFIHFFEGDKLEMHLYTLRYSDTNTGISIVWGCSGIKEIIMTILVISTARGNRIKKLWYIPLGVIFIVLINLIRLITLALVIHHHSEYFDFLHEIVFRGIIYGGVFSVWLLWIENIKKTRKAFTI